MSISESRPKRIDVHLSISDDLLFAHILTELLISSVDKHVAVFFPHFSLFFVVVAVIIIMAGLLGQLPAFALPNEMENDIPKSFLNVLQDLYHDGRLSSWKVRGRGDILSVRLTWFDPNHRNTSIKAKARQHLSKLTMLSFSFSWARWTRWWSRLWNSSNKWFEGLGFVLSLSQAQAGVRSHYLLRIWKATPFRGTSFSFSLSSSS